MSDFEKKMEDLLNGRINQVAGKSALGDFVLVRDVINVAGEGEESHWLPVFTLRDFIEKQTEGTFAEAYALKLISHEPENPKHRETLANIQKLNNVVHVDFTKDD